MLRGQRYQIVNGGAGRWGSESICKADVARGEVCTGLLTVAKTPTVKYFGHHGD